MKRVLLLGGLFCVLGGVTGCGDTPKAAFRDAALINDELADLMTLAYDDKSVSGPDMKERLDKLKAKWEGIQKRMGKFSNDAQEDAQVREAMLEGELEMLDEILEANLRLKAQVERLTKIKEDLGTSTPNLDSLVGLAGSFKVSTLWGEDPFLKGGGSGFGPPQGGMPGGGGPPQGMPGGGMPGGAPGAGPPGGPGGRQGGGPPGGPGGRPGGGPGGRPGGGPPGAPGGASPGPPR
jgi:hypothetical protein